MNVKLDKRRLIALLAAELGALLKIGGACDHARGVCHCAAHRAIELAKKLLAEKRKKV